MLQTEPFYQVEIEVLQDGGARKDHGRDRGPDAHRPRADRKDHVPQGHSFLRPDDHHQQHRGARHAWPTWWAPTCASRSANPSRILKTIEPVARLETGHDPAQQGAGSHDRPGQDPVGRQGGDGQVPARILSCANSLHALKKELGDERRARSGDRGAALQGLKKKKMPKQRAQEEAEKQLKRLEMMHPDCLRGQHHPHLYRLDSRSALAQCSSKDRARPEGGQAGAG